MKKVAVVGGGAAGFFCAIHLAQRHPDYQISIFERGSQVLEKVKISGGGRCNVTHQALEIRDFVAFYPRGNKELYPCFHRFGATETYAWYENMGVKLKTEPDGRVFPCTDSSQTIIDCLLSQARTLGIQIHTKHRIDNFFRRASKWVVEIAQAEQIFDTLVLTSGGSTAIWKILANLGHTIASPVPSLFTFNVKHAIILDLPGLVLPHVTISIKETNHEQSGPLLITHWGLSGPAILKLSAVAARELADLQYKFHIDINISGLKNMERALELLQSHKYSASKRPIYSEKPMPMPNRFWEKLLKHLLIPEKNWADLTKGELQSLAKSLVQLTMAVTGKSTNKDEFVTAGGVSLKEVDFKTMESKLLPHLYFAGEVLNIDALTGGFNFQAAWTTAWIAAQSIDIGK
ncbi:MAG: NAD(P)/FAD-dependent oxidoreductase [Chitinophagales bacterium]|nr:NAD(P)/FAD-dependent oxidoreductase [Chitinophagales bacterium]